jgi:hypothetical protein
MFLPAWESSGTFRSTQLPPELPDTAGVFEESRANGAPPTVPSSAVQFAPPSEDACTYRKSKSSSMSNRAFPAVTGLVEPHPNPVGDRAFDRVPAGGLLLVVVLHRVHGGVVREVQVLEVLPVVVGQPERDIVHRPVRFRAGSRRVGVPVGVAGMALVATERRKAMSHCSARGKAM